MAVFASVEDFKAWFEEHVSLDGKPYTLDFDQANAVFDNHKNTLITARAGSGKTRVIVAKVAYLIAQNLANLDEIAVFMFNRAAAEEVNERIGGVMVDGVALKNWQGNKYPIKMASTFHKFALDIVKLSGEHPQLISEKEHDFLIRQSLRQIFEEQGRKLSLQEREEITRLVSSFIARAGQKYSGENGLLRLCDDIGEYIQTHQGKEEYQARIGLHKTALSAYEDYLLKLNYPKIDFNILMARATRILEEDNKFLNPAQQKVANLKYILVDEYQDFSYLFFSIIQAMRNNCPSAHLFSVGDDWQAINRFAGSDVDYFINFAKFFPEDNINIPLQTNYRSARRIVENANKYMLKNYDRKAKKAIPFNKKKGKIKRISYTKVKFDTSDLYEDALKDAKYQLALAKTCGGAPGKYKESARLLKATYQITKKHRREGILLLHRHNFTSFLGVNLENFTTTLKNLLVEQNVLTRDQADSQIRCLTMHRSKGLESDVVIMLEVNKDIVLSNHPHATIFEIFGDTLLAQKADQQRLLYVAMTRAKQKLYILSGDKKCPI